MGLTLTRNTAVDIAYIPLYQLRYGELYVGGFQIGTNQSKRSVNYRVFHRVFKMVSLHAQVICEVGCYCHLVIDKCK